MRLDQHRPNPLSHNGLIAVAVAATLVVGAAMLTAVTSGEVSAQPVGAHGTVATTTAAVSDAPTKVSSTTSSTTSSPTTSPPALVTTPAPASSTSARATTAPAAGTALAALALVAVKGRAPRTGYDRARFGPAWADTDRNGCDTRNDVLRRDLRGFVLKAGTHGCLVLTGTLHDPYTGRSIAFVRGQGTSSAVQVDHVVALSDAWQKGAQRWSADRRERFANDPLNLLAVDGPTNERKGDGDAATWLPPLKSYRCAYVARQVAVKVRYGLWMTAAERAASARVLSSCPAQRLPVAGGFRLGGGSVRAVAVPTTSTAAPPAPTSTTSSAVRAGVHPGAFCAPRGALGRTSAGTLMRCGPSSTDSRNRWRRA